MEANWSGSQRGLRAPLCHQAQISTARGCRATRGWRGGCCPSEPSRSCFLARPAWFSAPVPPPGLGGAGSQTLRQLGLWSLAPAPIQVPNAGDVPFIFLPHSFALWEAGRAAGGTQGTVSLSCWFSPQIQPCASPLPLLYTPSGLGALLLGCAQQAVTFPSPWRSQHIRGVL